MKIKLALLGALGLVPTGCDLGGLNQNQQNAGNQDDGVNLSFGDIAVDPTGAYFLSRNDDSLVHANIHTGGAKVLPGIEKPSRLAFDRESQVVYVTMEGSDGDELVAYDVRERKTLWSLAIHIEDKLTDTHGVVTYPLLEVTEDNENLLLTHERELEILRLNDGETVRSELFTDAVVDIDVTPDATRVLVTTEHEWVASPDGDTPNTHITDVPRDPKAGPKQDIEVPNCADELVVAPDGGHAFLAPTTCKKDPISIIDLETREFVKNLPGFGPVAMSPSGEELVGFLDLEEVDVSLFDDPEDVPSGGGQFHMMFIDATTLGYDFLALGDSMPRYAMTPDGKVLLVDSTGWFEDERLRVVDIAARSIEQVSGPVVQLDNFVMTADSERVFLLDSGLFDLDIPARDIDEISVGFEPKNINITPNDTFLLLRETDTRIQVFDIGQGTIVRAVEF